MQKIKLSLFLLFSSATLFGQSTLNATGGGGTIGANTYDYSVGEMSLVSTFSSATVIVTQGILQPQPISPTGIQSSAISKDQLQIYPNPGSTIVYIQTSFLTAGQITVALLDAIGRELKYYEWPLINGIEKHAIDMSHLAQGNYFLNVNFNEQQNTYKIQKIN